MLDAIQRAEGAYQGGDPLWVAAQFSLYQSFTQLDNYYADVVEADANTLGLVAGGPDGSTGARVAVGVDGGCCRACRRAWEAEATPFLSDLADISWNDRY
jgi:hypothetical protein